MSQRQQCRIDRLKSNGGLAQSYAVYARRNTKGKDLLKVKFCTRNGDFEVTDFVIFPRFEVVRVRAAGTAAGYTVIIVFDDFFSLNRDVFILIIYGNEIIFKAIKGSNARFSAPMVTVSINE